VVLEQRVSREIALAVNSGEVDVGICRAISLPGLGSVTIRREAFSVLAMPVDHPLVERDPLMIADLDGATVIGPNPAMGQPLSDPEKWRQLGVRVRMRYERLSDEADLLDRVAAGYGVCLVTQSFAERNHRDDIVARPCLVPVVWLEDHLIWRLDNEGPIVSALIRTARAMAQWPLA
jgi:DNA-binding transcriptional LysR family regulator